MSKGIEILCDSHHGVFIPSIIIESLREWDFMAVNRDDIENDLKDPQNDFYWDSWEVVLDNAQFIDSNGNKWNLHHDGDLFAYCEDLMTDEGYENFFGEKRIHVYTYQIDLDERGDFKASVSNSKGETVYQINGGDIFEDGFMKHKEDISGLEDYLIDLEFIPKNSQITFA